MGRGDLPGAGHGDAPGALVLLGVFVHDGVLVLKGVLVRKGAVVRSQECARAQGHYLRVGPSYSDHKQPWLLTSWPTKQKTQKKLFCPTGCFAIFRIPPGPDFCHACLATC